MDALALDVVTLFITGSSPPVGFMATVLNATAVQLSWQYPEIPNGQIRGYSIIDSTIPATEIIVINITLDTVDDTSNQTTTVSELRPFTLYSFRVRAFSFGDQNSLHVGISSDEVRVRTDEHGEI